MMKILLVCAGGFSTTMMMEEIKKTINGSQKLNLEDFTLEAISVDRLAEKINNFEVILVGPQLSHKYKAIEASALENNKPSVLLSAEIYGAMDGATVLKQALLAHKKHQMSLTE
ncbi:PTS sugar transporter subunit IIB [Vibrio ichthyoenteri]|nr:PTS sugar transporter subunit IIB [Vibrio ichthyoenteri]